MVFAWFSPFVVVSPSSSGGVRVWQGEDREWIRADVGPSAGHGPPAQVSDAVPVGEEEVDEAPEGGVAANERGRGRNERSDIVVIGPENVGCNNFRQEFKRKLLHDNARISPLQNANSTVCKTCAFLRLRLDMAPCL